MYLLVSWFLKCFGSMLPPTPIPLFLIPGWVLNKSLQRCWRYHNQLALRYLTGVGREEPWADWQRSRFQLCFQESPQNQSWSARTWIPQCIWGLVCCSQLGTPASGNHTLYLWQHSSCARVGQKGKWDWVFLEPLSKPSLLIKFPCVSPFVWFPHKCSITIFF